MADFMYTNGLDQLDDWTTDTYKALLLVGTGYTPSPAHDVVNDVVAYETALSGYSRQTLGSKTRTVDDTNLRIALDCADPAFGSIAVGGNITAMVVYRFVTNDADSLLIGYFSVSNVATDGAAFTPSINATGLFTID